MMDAGLKRNCSRPYATASRARIAAPTRTVTLRSTTFQRQRDRTSRMMRSSSSW